MRTYVYGLFLAAALAVSSPLRATEGVILESAELFLLGAGLLALSHGLRRRFSATAKG